MKQKYIAVIICIALTGVLLAGCSKTTKVDASLLMNSEIDLKAYEEAVEPEVLDEDYADGLNKFAYQIFRELQGDENIVFSPYSISLALSMLYNGTDSKTREEMAELLGYQNLEGYTAEYSEQANQYMNANSKLLMDSLEKADKKVEFNAANSIWLSNQGKFSDQIETALLAPVRYFYDGDIFNVDFMDKKTLEDLNLWVSERTDGMIDPFLDSFSNPEMLRLFLVNAVYFNGEWSLPFEPRDTSRGMFYGAQHSTEVDMMHLTKEKFRYYKDDGIQGIELPYGNGRIVMDVLIPTDTSKKDKNIRKLFNDLTPAEVDIFFDKLDMAKAVKIGAVALPKFEMEYGLVDLNDSLKELGMEQAFLEGEADLSLIGDDLFVSHVMHKAKIEVAEWGTKAAAATGIGVDTTSVEADPLIRFIVDVPFLFFIRDTQTDTILFMGGMNQPE
ncbi:MAG TPA: serpin family protein [Mobilitalea sp.]|nr:serpin family protein [Mobilitalea sp.]